MSLTCETCPQHDEMYQTLRRIETNTEHLSALEPLSHALVNLSERLNSDGSKPSRRANMAKFLPPFHYIVIVILGALLVIDKVAATGVSFNATPSGGISVEAQTHAKPRDDQPDQANN